MGKKDPRVDAYIARSGGFAQPILEKFRETVHATCPEVEETMKWSFPHFQYHGLLCSMAAFKEHCAFGFWKGALVVGEAGSDEAMGQLGRIEKVSDLPSKKVLTGWIRTAMALNETGTKRPARGGPAAKRDPDAKLEIPPALAAALAQKANAKARRTFEGFPPSAQRDYADWIAEAKREETRATRLRTTLEWLAEGKRRNWKYAKC